MTPEGDLPLYTLARISITSDAGRVRFYLDGVLVRLDGIARGTEACPVSSGESRTLRVISSMAEKDLSKIVVLPRLPVDSDRKTGKPIPSDLVGAVIVQIGGASEASEFEGGGLVIDYRPAGSTDVRRVVFEFNEIGMWVNSQDTIKT